MRRLVVAVALVLGCGEATPVEKLQGAWSIGPGTDDCTFGVDFSGDVFAMHTVCPDGAGGFGNESFRGAYRATDAQIFVRFDSGSCPARLAVKSPTFSYSLDGNTLSLMTDAGAIALGRTSTTLGAAAFGCLNSDGTFTPNPITPL